MSKQAVQFQREAFYQRWENSMAFEGIARAMTAGTLKEEGGSRV